MARKKTTKKKTTKKAAKKTTKKAKTTRSDKGTKVNQVNKYEWAEGACLPGDATKAGRYVEKLAKKNSGAVTPEQVLEDAENPRSYLNQYFEWDDTEAAHQHRLSQARKLLRSIILVQSELVPQEEISIRAFPITEYGTSQYTPVETVLADSEMTQVLLEEARKDLKRFEKKYRDLEELNSVLHHARMFLAS